MDSLKRLKEPILRISDWFERHITAGRFNALAREGQPAYLFFDGSTETFDRWSSQLKFLVDSSSVKAVVTGSSALRIERGRDSLAGRISAVEAGVLSLTEIGALREMWSPKPFLADNRLRPLMEKDFWLELRAHGQANGEL